MSVLCAIDAPASAVAVARAAAGMARALGVPLVLAHVLPPPSRRARAARPGDAASLLRAHDAALGRALLDEVAAVLGFPVAEACLRSGAPGTVLRDLVRDQDAELLVVGARARGTRRAVPRAGVAATVLRRTGCPVLTVPSARGATASAALDSRRPVVCGVASAHDGDLDVALLAAHLAAALGASLDLVHIVSPVTRRMRVHAPGVRPDEPRSAVRRGRDLLHGVRDTVVAASPMCPQDVATHVRRGVAGTSPRRPCGPALVAHRGRHPGPVAVAGRHRGIDGGSVERDAAVCVLAARVTGASGPCAGPSRRSGPIPGETPG